jgi:hypothetical protein
MDAAKTLCISMNIIETLYHYNCSKCKNWWSYENTPDIKYVTKHDPRISIDLLDMQYFKSINKSSDANKDIMEINKLKNTIIRPGIINFKDIDYIYYDPRTYIKNKDKRAICPCCGIKNA